MLKKLRSATSLKVAAPLLGALVMLSACSNSDENTPKTLSIDMALPDSITGGKDSTPPLGVVMAQKATAALVTKQSADIPCTFIGGDEKNPFRNGYEMTKFMVSVVATWTCVTDTVIELSTLLPHDGTIIEGDNDTQASSYDSEEPTHYSITDDNGTQTTVRLYYGFDRATPPTLSDLPGFYLSWDDADNAKGNVQGKFIMDIAGLDKPTLDPKDPIAMRLDFNNDASQKLADVYLQFGTGNEWADGFRIEVTKDLTAPKLQQVFTAKGLMAMIAQFLPAVGVSETPVLKMYTVSNALGDGAALAEFADVALPLLLTTDNNMGDYIFSKEDKYFFDADQSSAEPWDWITKTIISSEYRGNRNTPLTGGTWMLPFNPSIDQIVAGLQLDQNYFIGSLCGDINSDCTDFLNAVINSGEGFDDQEKNQGSDPMDWRSVALQSASYLTTVYPNGENWIGAFQQTFTPANSN